MGILFAISALGFILGSMVFLLSRRDINRGASDKVNQQIEKAAGIVTLICAVLFVCLLSYSLLFKTSDEPNKTIYSCEFCLREFTNFDEIQSIKHTGMCTNCDENFLWGESAIGN